MSKILKHKPKTSLQTLIATYTALKVQAAKIEDQLRDVREQLLEAAVAAGGKTETPTHTITAVATERRTLQADLLQQKLLEKGVTPKIVTYAVEGATKVTTVSYARVDVKKER